MNTADRKDIGLAGELGRKAIHLFALVIPLGLLVVPHGLALGILLVAFLISVAVDLLRRQDTALARGLHRLLARVLRPDEAGGRFSGATYILAAGFLCPLLFQRPVAVAALIAIILGDTAAVFVGRYLGRLHIGRKTVEGSLGFFVAALLGILWIPQLTLQIKVIGAFTAAVTEALPLPIDDNLVVPLVSGAIMAGLLS